MRVSLAWVRWSMGEYAYPLDAVAGAAAINFLTAPVLWGLLALSALLGITAGVQTIRLSSEKAAHATTKTNNADDWAKQANLATRASELARAAETANAAATLAAKDQLTEALSDGKARADSLAADLRAERRKLRQLWTQGSGSCPMSEDSAALARGPDTAQLREEAISRVLGIAAEADARETYLIQRYDSAVATCNGEN